MAGNQSVAVIGAGAWGTALGYCVAQNKTQTVIWAFEKEVVESINNKSENSLYLPGFKAPAGISATSDMAEAVDGASLIIYAVPSKFMRLIYEKLGEVISPGQIIVSLTKGIETGTLSLPSDVAAEILPENFIGRYCCLSGPTFAKELVKNIPTAATIASLDNNSLALIDGMLSSPSLRLFAHDDIKGAELGGAIKNVIAIAAGISDGLGFGHNTRAAIITRGLAEMTRLGVAMGAKARTFSGLSGMGDLVLTCAGDLSRNRTLGLRIGKGEKPEEIISSMTAVAEGMTTSLSVHHLAEKYNVDMPITKEVVSVLYEKKDPRQSANDLMKKALTPEF